MNTYTSPNIIFEKKLPVFDYGSVQLFLDAYGTVDLEGGKNIGANDSVHDIILELMELKEAPSAIAEKIIAVVKSRDGEYKRTIPVSSTQRADVLGRFLKLFPPNEWTLVNWWSIQFAVQSVNTENLTLREVCKLLDIKYRKVARQNIT